MSDPKHLDLAISKIQGNMGLENISYSRYLGLAFRHLDLAVANFKVTWVWQIYQTQDT